VTALREEFADDLDALVSVLPPHIYQGLSRSERLTDVLEVVMDLGREPEARFANDERVLSTRVV